LNKCNARGKKMGELKLVSFDVWDTLLSVKLFYRSVALELAKITGRDSASLEKRLIEGYRKVRAIRRAGGFDDSKIVSMTLDVMAKFLNIDSEAISKAILKTAESHPAEQYLIEGAKEAVSNVKELGLKIIIVGNVVFWPGKINRILLEKAGLSNFIDGQFYADEVKISKPKPEVFYKAISEFDVQPEEGLHVGNSLFEDFAGAITARMGAILIDENVGGIVKLSDWNAYIIPNIKSLREIVNELLSS